MARGSAELGKVASGSATQGLWDRFRVRFGRERKACCLPCLSLGFGDDRQSMSEAEI